MQSESSSSTINTYSVTSIAIIGILINLILYICYYCYQYIFSLTSNIKINYDDQSTKHLKKNWISIPHMIKDLGASVLCPSELIAIFTIKFGGYIEKVPKASLTELAATLNDIDFCYATLNKVSRSFAVVIRKLPEEVKDSVCIFYLVLRGLDSVEDDMNYPEDEKIVLLRNFHEKLLISNWSIKNVGDTEDYQILLNNFDKVINVFKSLDPKYQSIILDITKKMGNGMADFVGKTGSIDTIKNYNLYCHYVAGLVGHGLSGLFAQSGLEDNQLQQKKDLSNNMGLFLQKTNIIRDYLEDLQAGRTWWPKEIWQNYASNLDDFSLNPNNEKSLQCLNHMVMDSFNHLPDVIQYLSLLKNIHIFQFCAIPQLMAAATLLQLYNNPNVFTSVVKIRKGLTCKLMLNSSNIKQVYSYFDLFIKKLEDKIPQDDHIDNKHMQQLVNQLKVLIDEKLKV